MADSYASLYSIKVGEYLFIDADKGGQILICLILVTLRQMSSVSFVLSFVKLS